MIVKGKTGLVEWKKKSDRLLSENSHAERDGIFNTNPIAVEVQISLIFQWKPESSDCIGAF